MDLEEFAHVRVEQRKIEEPILAVEPDHQEAAGPGHQNGGEDHHGGTQGTKLEIENQHDHQ